MATGVVVGPGGGDKEDEAGAGAATGVFASFFGPTIKLLIDDRAVAAVTVEMASGAVLAMATTEAFALPERRLRDEAVAGPTHSATSPSGSSIH